MLPTLLGRWQTRILLFLCFGVPITAIFSWWLAGSLRAGSRATPWIKAIGPVTYDIRPVQVLGLLLIVGIVLIPTTAHAADRGSYSVGGLGSRKQAVLNNGGTVLDLAIAMLETERMTTDYTYGDGKTGDAANFGISCYNEDTYGVAANSTVTTKRLSAFLCPSSPAPSFNIVRANGLTAVN